MTLPCSSTQAETSANESKIVNLFSPFTIGSVTLRNRIAVSPMCQYYSNDGYANDWHLVHLGSRAVGGAGLVMVEATGVEARGRITPDDLGIYYDDHVNKLKQITEFISSFGAIPGIQIAHAGRKASTMNPWKLGKPATRSKLDSPVKENLSNDNGGWDIVGPSAIPFSPSSRIPHSLSQAEIKQIQGKFVDAARRAMAAGFKLLEVHAAHGYLLHSFYSPLSNHRTDKYGGSFENRIRFPLEVVEEVRKVWPKELPLAVRLSSTDWVEGGWTVEDSVELAKHLKERAVDIIDCSSGHIRSGDRYNMVPGWQVPLAETVRKGAGIATVAVGMITEAEQANEIITGGQADIVMLARQMIRDPYWPYHAALALGSKAEILPPNYSYWV